MSCCGLHTNQFKIITCNCFYSIWKEIKDTNDESWQFDKIENGKKSFRKIFYKIMTIVHCCHSCFEKSIMLNPFILKDGSPSGYCIMKRFLNGINSCDEICNSCIIFFIEEFPSEFKFLNYSV